MSKDIISYIFESILHNFRLEPLFRALNIAIKPDWIIYIWFHAKLKLLRIGHSLTATINDRIHYQAQFCTNLDV